MANKHSLSNQPSKVLQDKFNEVCFRLGQEIANERRAIENQDKLKDQQEELEKAYITALNREQEAAAKSQKNEQNMKDQAEAKKAQEQAAQALDTPVATEQTGS